MIQGAQIEGYTKATKMDKDDSGKRYKQPMDKICAGKCSDNFKFLCDMHDPKQTGKFVCPK